MTDYFSSLAKKMEEIDCSYTAKQLAKPEWCIAELARLGYSIRFSALRIEHLEEQLGRSVACPEAFTPPAITYQLKGPLIEQWGAHPTCITDSLAIAAASALCYVCAEHFEYDSYDDVCICCREKERALACN